MDTLPQAVSNQKQFLFVLVLAIWAQVPRLATGNYYIAAGLSAHI